MNSAFPLSLCLLLAMPALLSPAHAQYSTEQQDQAHDAISLIKEISHVFTAAHEICVQVNNGTLCTSEAIDELDELSLRASAIKQRTDDYEAQCRAEGNHDAVTLQLSEYVATEEGSALHNSMRAATVMIRKTMRTTADARLHDALNQFFASMS